MNTRPMVLSALKAQASFALFMSIAIAASPAKAAVSQSPLLIAGGNVPGSLGLVLSVEYPTVISIANTGNYEPATSYVGYFNSAKCYLYDQDNEWFYPNRDANKHLCGGNKEWSGNFLNWAATPTIDPFRSALTGGYRNVDTATTTVLQKARHAGEDSLGNRMNNDQGIIRRDDLAGATPVSTSWSNFYIRLQGMGNEMLFSNWNDGIGGGGSTGEKTREWVYYAPNTPAQWDNSGKLRTAYSPTAQVLSIYRVKIRVKVCDPNNGLEANCERYPNGNYKPVGLMQQNANSLRYSVFGYLNDGNGLRDGGVLRAKQKFISPASNASTPSTAEWDANSGVFEQNPERITSALGRTINNSGVINYLNKFGELNNNTHKSFDPASELYYTALRYFKNQGNVAAYTTASPAHDSNPGTATLDRWHDNFPVITNWDDPINYACQKNVLLGIGDTNTWNDKNLPKSSSKNSEPTMPDEVKADETINVVTATSKVAQLEGITINTPFTGRANSAFIAGMAYDAHTKDQRADYIGDQTISTYWVDVREGGVLQGRATNQYWLAAKYGGFKVPDNYGDPYTRSEPLPVDWWHSTTDMLSTGDRRPDNFFVASDANNMVESLRHAFAKIVEETQSTTSAAAANSSRLDTGSAVFQSRVNNRYWSGDLRALRVGADGVTETTPAWSAAEKLDARDSVTGRKIFTIAPPNTPTNNTDPLISTAGSNFDWAGLTDTQKAMLQSNGESDFTNAQARLNYLRGDRSQEIDDENRNRPFRQRGSRLGDIVNSDPQYMGTQDFGYGNLSWSNGSIGSAYRTFRSSAAYTSRTPVVFVGANDGMLHAFDARTGATDSTGGDELFAYVPNGVFSNLIKLTEPDYSHRYYVDGTPRIADAYIGGSWKTLAIGTTGAGGKSVFALDVTDPSGMNSSKVLWEFTIPGMGYTMGQPALVPLPNERFGVIVTSGYFDETPASNNGKVWILDAANGNIIKTISLNTNGNLGAPFAADITGNRVADRIYVGDTNGNLWRIDLDGSNTNNWATPRSLGTSPLFVAKDSTGARQAITAPLAAALNEKGIPMVLFGTGSYYRASDTQLPNPIPVDTFYGIIDQGSPIDGRNDLLKQVVLKEGTVGGNRVRAISDNKLTTEKGWYLDLGWFEGDGHTGAKGERVVAGATVRGDRVIFTSMTPPTDPCSTDRNGTSFIMAMSLYSGSRLNYVYFDTNNDSALNDGDTATIGDTNNVPWSGISYPDQGVIKGAAQLFKWLCFAGSNGAAPKCIPVAGSNRFGRQTWREVREN